MVKFDDDLVGNSEKSIETLVKYAVSAIYEASPVREHPYWSVKEPSSERAVQDGRCDWAQHEARRCRQRRRGRIVSHSTT